MLSSRARGRLTVMVLGLLFLLFIGAADIALKRWRNEPPAPCGAVPSERQLEWLRMEWYAFVHFGINTFTNREWGFGDESPSLFSPSTIDVDGAVRAFREAGMSGLIYTAKHHDGFCLWPTRSTQHNVTHSPWKNGQGDVVRLFADSCAKEGLKFGVYISPWDRHHAEYGRAGYLVDFEQQVRELLTHYGEIFEIWFDGAQGGDGFYGGARENRCIDSDVYYNFPRIINLVRQLQPNCIVWGADNNLGDVRWGGSEKGYAPYPCVNVVNPDTPNEKWISWEADTTINRAGWFWHPGQQSSVKSPQELMEVYFASVGRGANLILNVALNRDGQADGVDLASLAVFGEMRRKLLAMDYALGAQATASSERRKSRRYAAGNAVDGDEETYWCSAEEDELPAYLELRLPKPATFDVVRLREQIRLGQRVQAFRLEAWRNGAWEEIDGGGLSIGYQVMRRLAQPITTDRVRLVVTRSRACPCISEFSLLRIPSAVQHPFQATSSHQSHEVYLPRNHWSSPSSDAYAAWDGKEDTCWQSNGDSLILDLGETCTFNGFACLPCQNDSLERLADHYRLDVSADAQNWSTVSEGEFSNIRANPILQHIAFPSAVTARYVRLTGLSTQKSFITAVAEFYLIAPPMPLRSNAADNDTK